MKVSYPLKDTVDVKEIKEMLKLFGGRCAKIVDGVLEYQVKDDNYEASYQALKDKDYID